MKRGLLLLLMLAPLAGCSRGGAEKPASTLTEAQRDSAIARSNLPGASVVGRALDVSGKAETRAAGMDTVGR